MKQKFKLHLLSSINARVLIRLLKSAAEAMRDAGLYQWDEEYPKESVVTEALIAGDTYGYYIGRELVGTVTLDERQDSLYAPVDWKITKEKIGVIHRLAVSPKYQGMGLGKMIMNAIHEVAIENEFKTLRLDAFSTNPKIQKLYRDLGYSACGEIYIYSERPSFICFEKEL